MQTGSEGRGASFRVSAESASGYAQSGPGHDGGRRPGSVEGRMLRALLKVFGDPRLRIVLWNGDAVYTASEPPVATFHIADRASLLRLCADPDVQFGELYSSGDIRVEGDLALLLSELYRGNRAPKGTNAITLARRIGAALHRRPENSLTGSRDNIQHHYDIGNEFYSLWLGRTMAYTCAYFPTPQATLDEAQAAKMDHVCRKLRLKPGQIVVEAGCGWGSLALHMARHYGVRVRAFNISREQIAYAREKAKAEGLDRAVEYIEDDYRNMAGQYDAFASVGMLEHVGVENYPELGRLIHKVLKHEGLGLIHTIGRNRWKPMHRWIDRRIFPGANPPALSQMMDIFEEREFSVLDVENIRLHYAKTLEGWLSLYEQAAQRVAGMFDERFVRTWRLYLNGSIAAFRTGEMQLFQVVFAHGSNNQIPWTRADIYA